MFSYFSSSSDGENQDDNGANKTNYSKDYFDGCDERRSENAKNKELISTDDNSGDSGSAFVNTTRQTTKPMSTSTAATTTATSWSEAHDMYCAKHGTLTATIQQVLSDACKENQEIPWELPRRNNNANLLLVEANEVAEFLISKRGKSNSNININLNINNTGGTSTVNGTTPRKEPSAASSWLMSPLKVVSAVASMMRDPDDDVEEWIQEGDDALLDDDDAGPSSPSPSSSSLSNTNTALGLTVNTPVANLNSTEAAIQCLENEIATIAPDTPHVLGLSEWNAWARCALFKHHTNKNYHRLSVHDNDFLLRVLVGFNKACIIQRQNQKPKGLDVVLLSSTTIASSTSDMNINTTNSVCDIPEHLRIPVTLWDIQKAEAQIETNLQDWSEQAAACTKKALGYKKQNQIKLATIQLAKRRVIQQRIDSDSGLQIQLLQTKNAIESAHSNRSMIDIVANSALLLKQLREETPLEEVDQTMDNLQSELDELQDINNAFSSIGGHVDDEEDELMKELESLTINENAVSAATATATGTIDTTRTTAISEKGNEDKECIASNDDEISELQDKEQASPKANISIGSPKKMLELA
mmetsp:Transcript_7497/g.16149  ORF Transcript_7497/g.16149 Transcript_7497/m.16149 type:complete len:586 (-) Transcript_7497:163-1920(-)|eukprot:CAMPEP_0168188116 /NCGR_PEP_ID=MMETSP0139_2-20121125/15445_1 /TAXON_ID=44445 /ORGANISM="Pseudo-nitzschia australis, Strain 10249 10 AB" /LENGTH=585 /DNA_ID=CAMNT_0008110471 /DNA_START=135 /DNA_END=1892 /DNA_ORIENTATION=-